MPRGLAEGGAFDTAPAPNTIDLVSNLFGLRSRLVAADVTSRNWCFGDATSKRASNEIALKDLSTID